MSVAVIEGRQLRRLPWLTRGLVAGFSGTAMMAAWYHLERTLRRGHYTGVATLADGTPVQGLWSDEGLDYDDSVVPGQIVANILNLPTPTNREAGLITLALRWTYGSAFGILHVLLRNRLGEPKATLIFGAALGTMTSVAFPVLGRTPWPWKWPLDAQVSAVGSHVAYVVTAAALDNALR